MNVAQLISEARGGDEAALGTLLDQYSNYLRLLARVEVGRRSLGKMDAPDRVQEAFVEAHRHLPNFRGAEEPQLLAWLRQILAAKTANSIRHYLGTKRRDIRLEQGTGALQSRIPLTPDPSPPEYRGRGEQTS